jgi:hypothetical protein
LADGGQKLRCYRIRRYASMPPGMRRYRLGFEPLAWPAEQGQVRPANLSPVSLCLANAVIPVLGV